MSKKKILILSLSAAGALLVICAVLFFTPFGYRAVLSAKQAIHTDKIEQASSFSELDSALNAHMIYALEMLPETEDEFALCTNLLRYLQDNAGISYIAADIGFCCGELINAYLEEGEEGYLDTALAHMPNAAQWRAFAQSLRTMMEEARTSIRLFGLGIETDTEAFTAYLSLLIKRRGGISYDLPEQIILLLAYPSGDAGYIKILAQAARAYPNLLNGYFKSDYFYFSLAINSVSPILDGRSDTTTAERSETFDLFANRLRRGKYFILSEDSAFVQSCHESNSSLRDRLLRIKVTTDAERGEGIYFVNNLSLAPAYERYMWLCDLYGVTYDRTEYDLDRIGDYTLIWNR